MNNFQIIASVLFISTFFACTGRDDMIQPLDTGYRVRYARVVVVKKGITLTVPIYGGKERTINETDMVERYGRQGIRSVEHLLGNMAVPVKDGSVGRTIGDILKFYRKSLLKEADIADPAVAGFEGNSPALLCYDFTWRGLPSSLMISVKPKVGGGDGGKPGHAGREGIIFIRIFLGSTTESLNLRGTCR